MIAIHLLTTLVYALVCLVVGLSAIKLFIRIVKYNDQIAWYPLIASGFLLGQGLFANLWLLIGLASLFKSLLIWWILMISGILCGYYTRNLVFQVFQETKHSFRYIKNLSFLWKALVFCLGVLIFIYGIKSIIMLPVGDAATFYMVLPKIMAASERLIPQRNYYTFSQIGLSGEMHFAALMAIGNVHAAKFYVWFTSLALTILLLFLCSESGLTVIGQIIALAMLFTSSTFTYYITNGKVDVFGGAFGIAAYYWALQIGKKKSLLPCIFTGLFTGFAIIAKLSNIPALLSGIFLLVLWNQYLQIRNKEQRVKNLLLNSIYPLLTISIWVFIAIIPHIIKNGILFGEPFVPFIFLQFTEPEWMNQIFCSPETIKYMLLTYPVALIFGLYSSQAGNLSVLILAYLPLTFLLKRPASFMNSKLFQITLTGVVGVIMWIIAVPPFISPAPRYILATFLLFIPLAAKSAENILQKFSQYQLLHYTVLISLFIVVLGTIQQNRSQTWFRYLSKFITGNFDQREVAMGFYDRSSNFLNTMAHQGDRIYIGGYFTYYLRPDLLQCISGHEESPKNWEELFDRGFTYLFIQKHTHNILLKTFDLRRVPPWMKVENIYEDDRSVIYRLMSLDSTKQPQFLCKQVHPPAWDIIKVK